MLHGHARYARRTVQSGVRREVAQGSLVGYLEAERVLVAMGQVPNVEGLGLEAAAVSYRRKGTITLVSEVGTDPLLGAHVVAPNAGDVIGEAVLAIRFGLTARDIVSTLHPLLTWGEAVKLAAQTFMKDGAKPSCCAQGRPLDPLLD